MKFKIPILYRISHYGIGFLSHFWKPLAPAFIAYQLLQLCINRRFFLFSMELKRDNSLFHTTIKLSEFAIGMMLAKNIFKENK